MFSTRRDGAFLVWAVDELPWAWAYRPPPSPASGYAWRSALSLWETLRSDSKREPQRLEVGGAILEDGDDGAFLLRGDDELVLVPVDRESDRLGHLALADVAQASCKLSDSARGEKCTCDEHPDVVLPSLPMRKQPRAACREADPRRARRARGDRARAWMPRHRPADETMPTVNAPKRRESRWRWSSNGLHANTAAARLEAAGRVRSPVREFALRARCVKHAGPALTAGPFGKRGSQARSASARDAPLSNRPAAEAWPRHEM